MSIERFAQWVWCQVKTSVVISTPLQGEAYMVNQSKLEQEEASAAAAGKSGRFKTVIDLESWKKRPEAPPPPPHNLAEAALNGLIAVRYEDTAFVLAGGIRVGLAMAYANEHRRAVQTLRSALNMAGRHRHEIAGQVTDSLLVACSALTGGSSGSYGWGGFYFEHNHRSVYH